MGTAHKDGIFKAIVVFRGQAAEDKFFAERCKETVIKFADENGIFLKEKADPIFKMSLEFEFQQYITKVLEYDGFTYKLEHQEIYISPENGLSRVWKVSESGVSAEFEVNELRGEEGD